MWAAVLFVVGVFSGATATVAGFGIGSLLTPILALRVGMPTAVAAVAVPHVLATAVRGWRLRRSIDWSVLRQFGLPSVVGSLAGALLMGPIGTRGLTVVLGVLLVLTGTLAVTGIGARQTVPRGAVLPLGAVSGLFGGLAGNQGGMRAVALLHFRLAPQVFVATATACGLLVDAARTPVYLWRAGPALLPLWPMIAAAAAGTLLGTLLGERILLGLSPTVFRRVVGGVVFGVGVIVLAGAL
jgi:uncharacterized membrane protein YfcA